MLRLPTAFALPWVTHFFRFSSYNSSTGANSNVWLSGNGTFGIGPASNASVNQRLGLFPFGLTRGAVAAFWQDLVFADLDPADPSGAVGDVCSKIDGSFPSRTLTITWKNMEITNAGARTGNLITFSSVLYESTDVVEYPLREAHDAERGRSRRSGDHRHPSLRSRRHNGRGASDRAQVEYTLQLLKMVVLQK